MLLIKENQFKQIILIKLLTAFILKIVANSLIRPALGFVFFLSIIVVLIIFNLFIVIDIINLNYLYNP